MAGYTITIAGDSALNIEFSRVISEETSRLIRSAAQMLEARPIEGVVELVPTICSLMVVYDPCIIGYDELLEALSSRLVNLHASQAGARRIFIIPVCYGGEYGPDIETVAEHAGLTVDEVIAIHSSHDYLIDMLGFLPGFAYLGGLDSRLHTPRLSTPRTSIPAGSVGIGGAQTGVYPLSSPGGWRLIGRTPVRPYDPSRERPILYAAGDYLRFVPVDEDEYLTLSARVDAGAFVCDTVVQEG